ncbi:trem-like transcript 4 protein [Pan troglodytes]|uniref:trem-like transcript 4 protein n=1 Tax=Pan troglodytes TaxID=9598 RepID=UPI0023F02362|nr:trem-like transcript 4 protein [Pan troglodytes]
MTNRTKNTRPLFRMNRHIRTVAGTTRSAKSKTLLLQCQYSPKRGPYQPKSWCQQASPNWCTLLVTSSKPQTAVQKSRYTIWDKPNASIFKITMIQLTQNDSGFYWCGIYNASENIITVLRNINLVVSPAPTTSPTWTLTWLPTNTDGAIQLQENKLRDSTDSALRKSSAPICLGSAGPKLLVSVLCGLLLAKGLML